MIPCIAYLSVECHNCYQQCCISRMPPATHMPSICLYVPVYARQAQEKTFVPHLRRVKQWGCWQRDKIAAMSERQPE